MLTDAFDWTWHSGSTPTIRTGPSSDHTTGGGHYLYIEANSATYGDTARLISSECSDSGPQCLQFWYHMYGSADTMGLHVYLFQNRLATAVWRKRNDQGNMWHLAQVDIDTTGTFQIIFEGRRGSNDQSDVAIDDIKLYRGRCSDLDGLVTTQPTKPDLNTTAPPSVPESTTAAPQPPLVNETAHPPAVSVTITPTVKQITDVISNNTVTEAPETRPPLHPECQLHCNFERGLCQWSQMLTDAFDWTWHSGSTPTIRTGPSSDHTTGGGHYLYIEANSATYGDTARLISSECSDSGPQCLQFWYHMYGSADTMGLHVYLIQNRLATAVWRKRNHQGNMWHLAQVDLATIGTFQIIFEGRRGSNDQSDVAIDDVSLHRGHCADLANPTTPAATARPQPSSTVLPEPGTTARPQPPSTVLPEPETTARPQPPSTVSPKPETTARPQPPSTVLPEPETTARPQPPSTVSPKPETTARPQPPSTVPVKPETTVRPKPASTYPPKPETTARPQPPSTVPVKPETTARPKPPSTYPPKPETTARPQPPSTVPSEPETARPQSPSTVPSEPETTPRPQPPSTYPPKPETTARPQPPSTVPSEPETARPQPPSTVPSEPETTPRPQPPSTYPPKPETTARPQPPITYPPKPETTARPQPPSTVPPKPETTAKPQPPSTVPPEQETTARPQPTTTHVPTPSCPANSHYTTCIPACSPTCTDLNGPPHCSDNVSCMAGCVCNDGFVQKKRACVPVQQCGCVDRDGTKYQFNEVWYTNHCSQKCECEEDDGVGKIDCDDADDCGGNAVCLQNEKGEYYCQSTGFGECTINGDPEYRTFDKMKHNFEGEHSYVLVRTSNLPNNLPDVYIEGINEHIVDDDDDDDDSSSEEDDNRRVSEEDDEDEDEDSEEQDDRHRLQGLKIRVYNYTVEFKNRRKLRVDGRRTNPPFSSTDGLIIWEHSSHIYLKTDFGLSVAFDGQSSAEIILPRLYKRKVGGLCGNFDGNRRNDKVKPDGTRASSTQEFGESWRV
ncbi:zonadhesin-like [Acanthochromis polyacanthus]|uniref:zonadhesin-like n=1 Tax=Acanthochromis polyacanthus TaxID=80966 RepID=UPI002234ABB7|nr:zonadhesin-like [Acanthochromis polyacanthus]